jgi:hypothetical protein
MPAIKKLIFLAGLVIITLAAYSQNESEPNWDNQIYIGNKIAGGMAKWRFSGELQVRLEDNLHHLDSWFLEGVTTYLVNKWFEVSSDFRFTEKPDKVEFRPGLGAFLKYTKSNFQFANQVKWQIDIDNRHNFDNGLRDAIFLNYNLNDKYIVSFAGGVFYRWRSSGWRGVQFIRFGPGISFVFDKKHILNINYFFSAENNTKSWDWAGIPMIQLVININKKYKYVPAMYFDF